MGGRGVCRGARGGGRGGGRGAWWPGAGRAPWAAPTYPFEPERHWVAEAGPAGPDADGDPLVGVRLRSPMLSADVFEGHVGVDLQPFLGDHRVRGQAVWPAAGFVAMALRSEDLAGGRWGALRDVEIHHALALGTNEVRVTQVGFDAEGTFRIVSRAAGEGPAEWTDHASGTFDLAGQSD